MWIDTHVCICKLQWNDCCTDASNDHCSIKRVEWTLWTNKHEMTGTSALRQLTPLFQKNWTPCCTAAKKRCAIKTWCGKSYAYLSVQRVQDYTLHRFVVSSLSCRINSDAAVEDAWSVWLFGCLPSNWYLSNALVNSTAPPCLKKLTKLKPGFQFFRKHERWKKSCSTLKSVASIAATNASYLTLNGRLQINKATQSSIALRCSGNPVAGISPWRDGGATSWMIIIIRMFAWRPTSHGGHTRWCAGLVVLTIIFLPVALHKTACFLSLRQKHCIVLLCRKRTVLQSVLLCESRDIGMPSILSSCTFSA